VTVTCGPPANSTTNLTLIPGTPQMVNNIAVGSTCTVDEAASTMPQVPGYCPQGTTPTWDPPIYSPSSPSVLIAGGPPATVTIKNTLSCKPSRPPVCDPATSRMRGRECVCRYPNMVRSSEGACICQPGAKFVAGRGCVRPPECRPPMVLNPAGTACICPPGTVQRGRECVRPPECRPPMVQGPRGACICPPGMVQRGRECVPRIECRPPAVPNAAGTACVCPPGFIARGRECIPVRPPTIDPRVFDLPGRTPRDPRLPQTPRDGGSTPAGPPGR
jgi:hypothetical protein